MSGEWSLKRTLLYASTLAAMVVLGVVVGMYVGVSGPHATVLAAVLPAILSLGGGLVVLMHEAPKVFMFRSPRDDGKILVNASVILFLIALFFGTDKGYQWKRDQSEISESQALAARTAYLLKCTEDERHINKLRKDLKLSPLGSEVFCR